MKILTDENTNYYKSVLENLITPYYDRREEVYGIIGQAIRDAMSDVEKQIIRREIANLQEQIKLINDNSASPGFLVDLAITALLGPLGGLLAAELTGRIGGFVKSMVKNRKANLAIIEKTMNDRQTFEALLFSLTDPTAHVKKKNQKVNDKLSNQINEWTKALSAREKAAAGVERATTIQEYVDYYSPAGSDITQALLPMMAEKFLPKKETSGALNSTYNKTDTEKNPNNRQDIFTTLTNIRDAYTHYSRIQINSDRLFHAAFKFFTNVLYSESTLDKLIQYFNSEKNDLDASLSDQNLIDQQFREYFKVIFWLLYLGDPDGWRDNLNHKFEKANPSKYDINDTGLGFRVSVQGVPDDNKYVKADIKTIKGERLALLPQLYVARLVTKVPRDLLIYLATNLHYDFVEETFVERARKLKQKTMGKLRGFGIDSAEPVTMKERGTIHPLDFAPHAGDTPYYDVEDLSVIMIMNWFKKIDIGLDRSNDVVTLLQNQKRFTGDVKKRFILP